MHREAINTPFLEKKSQQAISFDLKRIAETSSKKVALSGTHAARADFNCCAEHSTGADLGSLFEAPGKCLRKSHSSLGVGSRLSELHTPEISVGLAGMPSEGLTHDGSHHRDARAPGHRF